MRRRSIAALGLLAVSGLVLGAAAVELRSRAMAGDTADGSGQRGALASLLGLHAKASEKPEPAGVELRAPDGDELLVEAPKYAASEVKRPDLRAYAYEYASRIFRRPSERARAIGIVRRGTVLTAARRIHGPGCPKGAWYELPGGGAVCTSRGFTVTREVRDVDVRQPPPHVSRALPYDYGRINSREALRFYRIPSDDEEQEIEQALREEERLPEVVSMQLDGDYFVAIDREESAGGRDFYRTLRGRYVRKERVDEKPEPTMRGELLDDETHLPLAFVFGEDQVPLLRADERGVKEAGTAYKHARFVVNDTRTVGEREVAFAADGLGVARENLRIARRIDRPDEIARDAKWIHVDLTQQTLVAYEGDRPVFATLVSSGLEDGHATPRGLFNIREKHITTTMRGADPVDGPYEVAEVPWTMYYWESYALHGAYWHNDFGKTRSHGCTNLSPIDARWLFYWSDDELPRGWHGTRQLTSTQVYFTRADGDS